MPHSHDECRPWVIERVRGLAPQTILDIGVGYGTYARELRPFLPDCKFVGVEIFEPYVGRYELEDWYDELIIGDAREIEFPESDIVIAGDVLEHMRLDQAAAVWEKARKAARQAVFVSVPIVEYPQGAFEGNEHEAHLHTWTHDLVLSLPGVEAWVTGEVVGAYLVRPA